MELSDTYDKEGVLGKYIPAVGDVALDVGCNHGGWTVPLASRFRTVYAIDAQPACLDAIASLNLRNVVADQFAAWSNIGRLMFRTNVNKAGEHQGTIAGVDEFVIADKVIEQYEVPCKPLDLLNIHGRLDFIKMDVDGAEVNAIIGAQELLRNHKPALVIETHTDEARAFLLIYLRKLGYAPRMIEEFIVPADPNRWTDRVMYLYAAGHLYANGSGE